MCSPLGIDTHLYPCARIPTCTHVQSPPTVPQSLYSSEYFVLRYLRKTEGSRGAPVTAFISSSPLACSDPTLWIFSFSQSLKGLNWPAAMSFSKEGSSSHAFCNHDSAIDLIVAYTCPLCYLQTLACNSREAEFSATRALAGRGHSISQPWVLRPARGLLHNA